MKLKERCRKGKCCCFGCKAVAAEIHRLPDAEVWFCAAHAQEVWVEYEEIGVVPEVAAIGKELPEPEIGLSTELTRQIQSDQQAFDRELVEIGTIEITTQDELTFAEGEIQKAAERWKLYEEKRTAATKPLNQSLREINGWFKPVQAALKSIESGWKSAISRFRVRQREEQARLLAAAQAAVDPTEIRESLIAASQAEPVVSSLVQVDHWTFKIEDFDKIPREYLVPDFEKIALIVRAKKEQHGIPGVHAWNDPIERRK
jgi:hypothetical protein